MNETTEPTPLSPEAEDLALSNTPIQFLAGAYVKVSPEGQGLFRKRLGPVIENLSKTIAIYQEAEKIYNDIVFPLITVEADAA